jgi:hypothetical protein
VICREAATLLTVLLDEVLRPSGSKARAWNGPVWRPIAWSEVLRGGTEITLAGPRAHDREDDGSVAGGRD